MKQSHITLIALVMMIVAFAIAVLFYNSGLENTQDERVVGNNAVLIRDYSITAGNPAAKVTLVEFMDPACGTCAQFFPFVEKLMQHYSGKLKLVVRYLPFHQGSDRMVAILEAARKQDKFWEVLELMYASQSQWTHNHVAQPEVFMGLIEQAGVNVLRIKKDMNNPATQQIIQQDIADGELLGADKTPSFFVNGKPLPSFGYRQLQALVDEEIRANY